MTKFLQNNFMCGVPSKSKSMDTKVDTDADTDTYADMFNYAHIHIFCNLKKWKYSV